MRKVTVFLCVRISLEALPEQYQKAIEEFHGLEPEILCLPWPESAVPSVDSTIHCGSLPHGFGVCTVSGHEYTYYEEEEKGIRIEVYLEPETDSSAPPEKLLEYFADCGFVFFSSWDKPIKEILTEAGLYKTS